MGGDCQRRLNNMRLLFVTSFPSLSEEVFTTEDTKGTEEKARRRLLGLWSLQGFELDEMTNGSLCEILFT